MSTTMSKEKIL